MSILGQINLECNFTVYNGRSYKGSCETEAKPRSQWAIVKPPVYGKAKYIWYLGTYNQTHFIHQLI